MSVRQHNLRKMIIAWSSWCVRDMEDWCRNRMWLPRAALLLILGYFAVCHMRDPQYQDIFKGLNLGIHEIGHYLFALFGQFLQVSGGSLLQCLAPVASMAMFFRQRDYFAIAVCFGWLSTNLYDVAVYAGDARAMALPLVSPGSQGEIVHDWNFLLAQLGWLQYDQFIAALLRVSAVISILICILFGAWLCISMQQSKPTARH